MAVPGEHSHVMDPDEALMHDPLQCAANTHELRHHFCSRRHFPAENRRYAKRGVIIAYDRD